MYRNDRSPSPQTKRRRYDKERFTSERSRRSRSRSPDYRERRASPRWDEYSRPPEPTEPYYQALCVSSLSPTLSDEEIKHALYREFNRFEVKNIKIQYDLDERVAYVCFHSCEDARDAKDAKRRIEIYDRVAVIEKAYEVSKPLHKSNYRNRSPSINSRPYSGRPPGYYKSSDRYDHRTSHRSSASYHTPENFQERRHNFDNHAGPSTYHGSPYSPPQHTYDSSRYPGSRPPFKRPDSRKNKFPNFLEHLSPENDPLATRTLFVGNLEADIVKDELHDIFGRHGLIEDIDIKRSAVGTGNAYAFIRYQNLDMAHKAKVQLSGNFIGSFQCKIGYGKRVSTPCIWVGGLGSWTSITQLEREFYRFGAIIKLKYVKGEDHAYILYDNIEAASEAVRKMHGVTLGGPQHRLKIDFSDINLNKSEPNVCALEECSSPVTEKSRSPDHLEETSSTLSQVANECSATWKGAFLLKANLYPASFYLISGNGKELDFLIKENGEPQITITQRVGLEPVKLNSVREKILNSKSHSIILAMDDFKTDDQPDSGSLPIGHLNNFVTYFIQKNAAGITIVSDEKSKTMVEVFTFPYCPFSAELLQKFHPNLSEKNLEENHLVIVILSNDYV